MEDIREDELAPVYEILHHNRNRDALIKYCDEELHSKMNEEIAYGLYIFDFIHNNLTTESNEAAIYIAEPEHYINEKIAIEDTTHIYSYKDSQVILKIILDNIEFTSAVNNPMLKDWLNKRGVTTEQIIKYKLIDLSKLRKLGIGAIKLGATIHPALRHWITEDIAPEFIPNGILTPCFDLNDNPIGCHNRFLSTVPKIKFASSIPNYYLFTNLRNNSNPVTIFIVEGVFDALALDKIGHNRIGWIAPSTGFWTTEQLINLLSLLENFKTATIVCMFDNDKVGLKSNICLAKTLRSLKYNTQIQNFPKKAKDPSEAVNKYNMKLGDIIGYDVAALTEEYKNMPSEKLKPFEDYLDNRHASYSNENYNWN